MRTNTERSSGLHQSLADDFVTILSSDLSRGLYLYSRGLPTSAQTAQSRTDSVKLHLIKQATSTSWYEKKRYDLQERFETLCNREILALNLYFHKIYFRQCWIAATPTNKTSVESQKHSHMISTIFAEIASLDFNK